MSLKLRHLEVFHALLETGSVSRAAERLNLSQPAVSIALGNLEGDLGFRLFHRTRGYFAPTAEALLLHSEVAQGLRAVSRVEQRASEIRAGTTGGISIATNGALAMTFLPRLIAPFHEEFPGVKIEMRVHSSRQIASWVTRRQVDIGVIDPPVPVAGLNAVAYELPCVCIMRDDHPLAELDEITPQSLRDASVVGITGEHVVDRRLDTLLSETNTPVTRELTSYYFAIARSIVAAGQNVALIDPINGKAALGDGVVWRPFTPRVDHDLAVITPKGEPLGRAAQLFYERLCEGIQASTMAHNHAA